MDIQTVKVTIRDLPLEIPSDDINNFLLSFSGVKKIHSKIMFGNIRAPDGSWLNVKNGDRYCYIESPISPPLPKQAKFGNFTCQIYHRDQVSEKPCKVCKEIGHKELTNQCPAFSVDTVENNVPFRYPHVLSNFQACEITVDDLTVSSVEHAYQYLKAKHMGLHELSEQIIIADTAAAAKKLGNNIPNAQSWDLVKKSVMEDLIEQKINKCPSFKEALILSENKYLVEATGDLYWASGLSPGLTAATLPDFFPGENMLGRILMAKRENIQKKPSELDPPHTPAKEPDSSRSSLMNETERKSEKKNGKAKQNLKTRLDSSSNMDNDCENTSSQEKGIKHYLVTRKRLLQITPSKKESAAKSKKK
jgi:ribA/ribD-fused uncharacterized protein